MSQRIKTTVKWTLASIALTDAYTDFILSRQAMNRAPATLEFYKHTAGTLLLWIEEQGITTPEEVTVRYIRQYLAGLRDNGRKYTTLHANARAIRTPVRFWRAEKYIPEAIQVEMPKLEKKRSQC